MSKSRKKLEKAMSMIQAEDVDGHKQIYSYALEHMDPKGVPHIVALIYGSGRVLLPEMHWECTPELLDIFALAEAVRQQTVAGAREALLWDQFYRNHGDAAVDGEPLTDEERKTLKTISKKSSDETHRETYRTVVLQVCWAHVHRLRRSHETFLIPLLFRRYFPAVADLGKLAATDQCPLWLRDIAEPELVGYKVTRGRVMEFLEDAEQWEEEYFRKHPFAGRNSRAIRMTPEYQEAFWNRFPLIVGWDALTGIIQRHLTKIQGMVAKLHSVFPDTTPLSDNDADGERPDAHVRHTAQRVTNHATRAFSRPQSQRPGTHKSTQPATSRGQSLNEDSEMKKESQESHVSSTLSYVDVPPNVPHAPPTSLLGG